ncbi:hypothetical protein Cantr_03556 [Candida viswanathii]|uniref:Alcohol dehydrogenase-like C-terminal domain-containing protein n=1 Tax=Candida viswanathii TaxID=5486 RepID=A0A367YLB0_9ASCO|nr:hypothetical protein Cantr_03556 [Candida viswanathii]
MKVQQVSLGLCTVAQSFSHYLKLGKRAQSGDSILIGGGATATGVLAIQVAKLVYNLNVIATASPRNHEYLKELGADYVIDYNDADVVNKIKAIGKVKFALDTVSDARTYQKVYDATEGTSEVYLDNLLNLTADSIKTDPKREGTVKFGQTLAYLSLSRRRIFLVRRCTKLLSFLKSTMSGGTTSCLLSLTSLSTPSLE